MIEHMIEYIIELMMMLIIELKTLFCTWQFSKQFTPMYMN